jgi:hypothetical protein
MSNSIYRIIRVEIRQGCTAKVTAEGVFECSINRRELDLGIFETMVCRGLTMVAVVRRRPGCIPWVFSRSASAVRLGRVRRG